MENKRLIVGISGASGIPLAHRLLEEIKVNSDYEVGVVMTQSAYTSAAYELSCSVDEMLSCADYVFDNSEIGASIASGTFRTEGMIIVPCSMKTIAGIANGYADNLLLRAADVTIKERRRLVLVARETPLSPIHLKNLAYLSTIPEVEIIPPMLTYYHQPETIEDMEYHLIGKILQRFNIELPHFRRWKD